jgi:hypothetical protein
VLKVINFRFALFTPPLGDFHSSYPSAPRTPPVSPLRFPNLSPTLPPWTRPRPRISWPPLHALNPFRARTSLTHSPLLICALSRALSLSLSHPAHEPRKFCRSSWFRRRSTVAVEPPAVSVATVSPPYHPPPATPLGSPSLPLIRLVRSHQSVSCAAGESPSSTPVLAARQTPFVIP